MGNILNFERESLFHGVNIDFLTTLGTPYVDRFQKAVGIKGSPTHGFYMAAGVIAMNNTGINIVKAIDMISEEYLNGDACLEDGLLMFFMFRMSIICGQLKSENINELCDEQ